ncbi:MAG: MarC family protein [Parachlamydiaceae bacterium]|nr:MarC family protein [Parachlamydiaceae bacterium]
MTLFNIVIVLFLTMDPIGNINSYLSLVNDLPKKRQNHVIIREMLIALAIMVGIYYFGEHLFNYLELSETTVMISSGIILFLIAIKILFTSQDSPRSNMLQGEPFIFPLAVPLIAGPALLATIMLYSHLEQCQSMMLGAILIAWIIASLILYFSQSIKKVLGENGLIAFERLIGMVLVLIAIQRFMEGILLFISTHPNPQ